MTSQSHTQKSLIFEKLKQSLLKNLSHSVEVFFPMAHDILFERADKAENNSEQNRFFDAIATLNKVKEPLKNKFIVLIGNQLELCRKESLEEKNNNDIDELDLIDLNEFEHWLEINKIVVKISPHYEKELLEIELRLTELFSIMDEESGPFSPEIIFTCFSEATYAYFRGDDIILMLIHQFEKVMNNNFFELYQEINQIFIDNNILPVIEEQKLRIVKAPSSIDSKPSNMNVVQVEQSQTIPPTLNQTPLNTAQVDTSQLDVSSQHMTEVATLQNNVNLASGYQTLKDLFTFQNGQGFNSTPDEFYNSEDYKRQLSLLIDELTLLQIEQSASVNSGELNSIDLELLVSLVEESINKENYSIELHNEFQYSLDVIQRLFKFIESDLWLDDPVKKLLSLLKLPLLKVSLLHKDFFESWSNPVRIVINKLAMLEFYDESNPYFQKLLVAVVDILKNFQSDLKTFTNMQGLLTQLLAMQSQYYDKKINVIIKNYEAQQIVTVELARRLDGIKIPIIIADFISHQWIPVLMSCYLNKGRDSSQWAQYLQALDLLILTMTGDVNQDFIEHDVIIFIIKQGLEEIGPYDQKIVDDIENFLVDGSSDNDELIFDYELIFKLLIAGKTLSDKQAIKDISRGMTDARSKANANIAKRLTEHDFVQLKKDGSLIKMQFIWKSDNQYLFVFVTSGARKEYSFSLVDVLSMLDSGQLKPIKDYDLPLLERSLYAIMGEVHDNLVQQSAIDKVTGLMVHHEFERVFRDKLERAENENFAFALCLINIDNFTLINNTCGYEAGDKYLSEIAELLKQSLTDKTSEIVLARYGTDEFILLLPNFTDVEANEFTELLRQKVYQHKFTWEDKKFSLSSSIGLVIIPEVQNIKILLKAVVTASGMAKEYGRNRVHVLKADDIELSHHQELQLWATKIDDTINNNLLDIRCQRLHPMGDDSLRPHYEMLLLVKDEAGNTTPPAQFIEAAELYHKMVDVDRWVVENVFQWFHEHPDYLDRMGGVAINLSGQSLNDINFLEFVQSMFKQYPVSPQQICFEVTETVAIINMTFAIDMINSIRELGCEFALDDFGTGQSSYAYLKSLPVDYLKIDGVFIKDIVKNTADQAMVKSINEIGHFLGMKTIAEFVENNEIIDVLKDIGVDYAQGYGVEKPFLMTEYNLSS